MTRTPRQMPRVFSLIVLVALLALSSCRVSTDDVTVSGLNGLPAAQGQATVDPVSGGALPAIGPIPGAHWHAAYVVRICDDVLAPFDSAEDPLGIHSHADGLMHIHPFFESSGYEQATIGLFADAMGLDLEEGAMTLPGGGTWRDGDLCGEKPGRVFIDRWSGPSPDGDVERIFGDPAGTRFLADGELYQIAFAPVDSPPVVPPAFGLLGEVSNLNLQPSDPWVDLDPSAVRSDVKIWTVASVDAPPCEAGEFPERTLSAVSSCFGRAGEPLNIASAVTSARAVSSNRQPGVELQITSEFREVMATHFLTSEAPLVFAVEVAGEVIYAPQLARLPLSANRLVFSGGFSVDSASAFADLVNP